MTGCIRCHEKKSSYSLHWQFPYGKLSRDCHSNRCHGHHCHCRCHPCHCAPPALYKSGFLLKSCLIHLRPPWEIRKFTSEFNGAFRFPTPINYGWSVLCMKLVCESTAIWISVTIFYSHKWLLNAVTLAIKMCTIRNRENKKKKNGGVTALELYGIGNFLFMRAFNRYQIFFLKGSDKISAVSLKKMTSNVF